MSKHVRMTLSPAQTVAFQEGRLVLVMAEPTSLDAPAKAPRVQCNGTTAEGSRCQRMVTGEFCHSHNTPEQRMHATLRIDRPYTGRHASVTVPETPKGKTPKAPAKGARVIHRGKGGSVRKAFVAENPRFAGMSTAQIQAYLAEPEHLDEMPAGWTLPSGHVHKAIKAWKAAH